MLDMIFFSPKVVLMVVWEIDRETAPHLALVSIVEAKVRGTALVVGRLPRN